MILHIDNSQIPVYSEKLAEHNLHIMTNRGQLYYIPLVTNGNCIATGNETLFYEETSINTCNDLTLPAGCYRIEIRGGDGGTTTDAHNNQHIGQTETFSLNLLQPTQIKLFRGGDGIVIPGTEQYKIPMANNGLDTFVITPSKTFIASGGAPVHLYYNTFKTPNNSTFSYIKTKNSEYNTSASSNYTTINAPAGGDSPNLNSGATLNLENYSIFSGTNGTINRGGNGGDILYTNPDGTTISASCGQGGETISYTCGTHTTYAYGTGGMGAACYKITSTNEHGCFDGTDGASGNSGTSNTSYIKIYKL